MRARAIAVTALVAMLLVACGEGSQLDDVVGGDEPTTTAAPGAPATARSAPAPTGSDDGVTGPAHPAGAGKPSSGQQATSDAATASPNGEPGSYAGVLLRPKPAGRIGVELLVAPGAEPADGSVARLQDELERASAKPVTLTRGTAPSEEKTWTAGELRSLAKTAGRVEASDAQAVLHVIFVRGRFEDENTLGVTLSGSLIVVFPDQVASAGGVLTGTGPLERAVVVHELGHVMGLVDLFLDRGRDDPEHPGHSTNRSSVMYWAIESGLVAEVLSGPPPEHFDEDDVADLAMIRAGG